PLGLEEVPHTALEVLVDEILAAPTTAALLLGVYEEALPALEAALENHLRDTNPLVDAPTVRIIRFALLELAEMIEFGNQCTACLVEDKARHELTPWLGLLGECLAAAGGLDGSALPSGKAVQRQFSKTPYIYERVPRRDERFADLWNQGVNAESF